MFREFGCFPNSLLR